VLLSIKHCFLLAPELYLFNCKFPSFFNFSFSPIAIMERFTKYDTPFSSEEDQIQRKNPPAEPEKWPIIFEELDDPVNGGLEAAKLLYTHTEVEVKRYRERPTRLVRNFRVTKVISPHLFITEFAFDKPCGTFKDWRDAMQDFYNNDPDKTLKMFELRTSVLLKYRCYAFHDPETGMWERVRVMKYDTRSEIAEIYMFEHTEFRIAHKRHMMELNPEFSTWAAYGYPTHLLNIKPANGALCWSREAVDYFKKLVKGKSFSTIVITRTIIPFPEGFPEVIEFLAVCMIQRSPKKNITLQAEMVKAGFAEATGVLAGYSEMMESKIGRFNLKSFEKEKIEEFAIATGKFTMDIPPTAFEVGNKLKELFSKSEAMRSTIGPEDATSANFSIERFDYVPEVYAVNSAADNQSHLPAIFKNAICQIRFTHVASPSVLYVQLEKNMNELREMETALSLMVQHSEVIPWESAQPGLQIACLVQINRYQDPSWVRAVIRNILRGGQLLKVILVDYGTEVSIKANYIRHLPSYFQKIPSFAFRVHFDSDALVPTGSRQWSTDATETFRKYMSLWNKQVPIYYMWLSKPGSVVELQDFNQDLHWDHLIHKWQPTATRISTMNATINTMSDSPLLRNYYVSVGFDVMFEVMNTNEKSDYTFESVTHVLSECGFGTRLRPLQTIERQHNGIILECLNEEYVSSQKGITNFNDTDGNQQKIKALQYK